MSYVVLICDWWMCHDVIQWVMLYVVLTCDWWACHDVILQVMSYVVLICDWWACHDIILWVMSYVVLICDWWMCHDVILRVMSHVVLICDWWMCHDVIQRVMSYVVLICDVCVLLILLITSLTVCQPTLPILTNQVPAYISLQSLLPGSLFYFLPRLLSGWHMWRMTWVNPEIFCVNSVYYITGKLQNTVYM